MSYYTYVPHYPVYPFLYYPTYIDARTVYPVNTYYAYPSYVDYRNYSVPTYPINETNFYLGSAYRQGTVSLQNAANTQWENHYLDIDGNTGQVILWPRLGSGGYWKLTDQGNGTVSLQNAANTQWKDHYLDIDGNTGQVILWPRLGSGGYWKLTDHGNGTVSLQNAANTQWKDHYLDIDGNTGQVILWPRLGSGGYWKLTNHGAPSKRFPIKGSQHTELRSHRRMATDLTISKNGRIDMVTRTWTSAALQGFTGTVVVFLKDADGNIIHATVPQKYGVSGVRVGGHKRTDTYTETIPVDLVNQTTTYAILHSVTPINRISPSEFKKWADVIEPLVKAYAESQAEPQPQSGE